MDEGQGTSRKHLDVERVVGEALALLDEVGFEALTVRRLAARLGVQNPALYWHFRNKQEIVDRMAARLLAGSMIAPTTDERWDGWLSRAAHAFRGAILAHRDGARVLASADLSHSPMGSHLEQAVQLLVAAGFARRDAFMGVVALFDYTLGATFEEQADPVRGEAEPLTGLPTWTGLQAGDSTFEEGVRLLLDGLATRRRDVAEGRS